jgi:lipopolysaccharide heptosyltransferase II
MWKVNVWIRWAESRAKKLLHGVRVLRSLAEAAAIRVALPAPAGLDPGGLPAPGSVVILGTGYIGDLVLATPTLRAIREAFPQARITLLVEERVIDLFAEADIFDRLLTVTRGTRRDLLAHARMLRGERPDVAVVLPHTVTAALFARATCAPVRVGHDSQGRRFLLTRTAANEKTIHEVERLFGLVRALGVLRSTAGLPRVWPLASARQSARRHLERLAPTGGPIIALTIGATNPARRWPPARWALLIRRLALARNARFVLIGAAVDQMAAAEIVARVGDDVLREANANADRARLLNLAGRTSLAEVAWLFDVPDLVVGSDSGLLHVAAARGAKVVGLYGPGDPVAWGPFGTGHAVVRLPMACSPCANHVCSSVACIRLLPVEAVVHDALLLLDGRRAAR